MYCFADFWLQGTQKERVVLKFGTFSIWPWVGGPDFNWKEWFLKNDLECALWRVVGAASLRRRCQRRIYVYSKIKHHLGLLKRDEAGGQEKLNWGTKDSRRWNEEDVKEWGPNREPRIRKPDVSYQVAFLFLSGLMWTGGGQLVLLRKRFIPVSCFKHCGFPWLQTGGITSPFSGAQTSLTTQVCSSGNTLVASSLIPSTQSNCQPLGRRRIHLYSSQQSYFRRISLSSHSVGSLSTIWSCTITMFPGQWANPMPAFFSKQSSFSLYKWLVFDGKKLQCTG